MCSQSRAYVGVPSMGAHCRQSRHGHTMVMRAFLSLPRRALWVSSAAPRSMLETTSPLTRTKSLLMISFMSISRSASPAVLHAVDEITCRREAKWDRSAYVHRQTASIGSVVFLEEHHCCGMMMSFSEAARKIPHPQEKVMAKVQP